MFNFQRLSKFVLTLGALVPASAAFGAVSLILTDSDTSPSAAVVSPSATFPLTVSLRSSSTATADQATGLDYFLQVLSGPANSKFSLTSRSVTSSSFPDTFFPDATISGSPSNQLNPKNGTDLGGSETNPNVPVSNGTFNVANFVITVGAGTPLGTYVLSAVSDPGTGYVGPGPGFPDTSFTTAASTFPGTTGGTGGTAGTTFQVTVVPEPAIASLLALGALGFIRRRGRSTR